MYTSDYAKQLIEMVHSFEIAYREMMEEWRKANKPIDGSTTVDDETYAAWFEMKAAENPNWVLALPYVEGGNDLLKRYEKVRGII